MTYLCMGNISPSPHPPFGRFPTAMNMVETSTKESGETVNSRSLVEVRHSVGADNVALPTFTADLVNKNKCMNIRIFKDGGSQRNFITHDLARQMNFPIIESNTCINIKGFVSKRSITTNIVSVSMMLGQNMDTIPAICVDTISTTFRVTDFETIVDSFKNKGYDLADKKLIKSSDTVSNMGMILGSESSYILPSKDVLFGNEESPSVYIETPIGIMFSGSFDLMVENCKYLPCITDNLVYNHNASVYNVTETAENEVSHANEVPHANEVLHTLDETLYEQNNLLSMVEN